MTSSRRSIVAGAGLAIVLVLTWVAAVSAQSARVLVEEGNRLYEEGRFQEAHEAYLEAMAQDPESPIIPFNDGNALYQGADYQRAMEAYREAIASGDPELAAGAWYNLGNALYRQQQLEQSIEAYKQALRTNPDDVDAKRDLERALRELQRQQQDQPQNQESGEEGDQSEQDPQPPPPGDQLQDPGGEGEGEGEQNPRQPPPGEPDADGEDERDEARSDEGRGEDDPRDGTSARGAPQPGEMTEEEARRLLDAIDEDPEDVNRKPLSARGRRPQKPW